jgi:hypothetical protein
MSIGREFGTNYNNEHCYERVNKQASIDKMKVSSHNVLNKNIKMNFKEFITCANIW